MAESDSAVEILKDIRDEIRGARNELRDEIRGVRTERVERPGDAWRRRALPVGIVAIAGAAAVFVGLLAFRGGARGVAGDNNVGAEHVVEAETNARPVPSIQVQPPSDPPLPVTGVTPATASPAVVAPRPAAIAAPKKLAVRRRALPAPEAELEEPAKL